ncbi:MAG: HIT family protein [Kiloniellaceae bacterium]
MIEPRSSGDCPFCGIAAGRFSAHIVAESPRLLAFLDRNPIRPGHIQIIPRAHFPCFNALPPDLASELLRLGQRLGEALRSVCEVDRVGYLFPAGDIPHAQGHVVPLLSAGDVTARRYGAAEAVALRNGPPPADPDLSATARDLRRSLAGLAAAP